jgi:hypothetical protein
MRTIFVPALALVVGGALFAQSSEEIHHHNITVGGGAAAPVGNDTNYLSTAPAFSLGYGYRFNRWFQADAGFQMAFGAANNQNAEVTDFGTVQGGDHEFMIPLGGRVFIPLPFKRLEASVGGGGAYLHYSETAPSGGYGGYYTSQCYTCTSRGGWGGYGLGNVTYFLDSNHNFRLGVTAQYVAGSTNGQPVANIPAIKTTDHWMNTFVEFGMSF